MKLTIDNQLVTLDVLRPPGRSRSLCHLATARNAASPSRTS